MQTAPGAAAPPSADGGAAGRLPARPAKALARATAWYAALPPRRRAVAQDAALALGLAVLNLLSLLTYLSQLHPAWLALLVVAGQCLPLALRRVLPVPALIGCGLIRNVYDAFGFPFAPLPLAVAIAFGTVAERSGRVWRWLTIVGTCIGVAWSQTLPGHTEPYDAIVQACIFGAAWALGTLSRYHRAALAAAASRADRAEAAVDQAAAGAAAAERLRIARELHDVVAHHVSLMAVQAEAVGALLPARPEAAAASADLIGSTARTAMSELRRLLGVLRFTDYGHAEQARLTPVPSLARLDELLDVVREAGLRVTCRVSGPAATLPPGVDLTAYRILQEALTNALRHAPGSAASVRLIYTETDLTVEATNTVPVPAAAAPVPQRVPGVVGVVGVPGFAADSAPLSAPADLAELSELSASAGPGYGLAGIAERVASCGGFLALGPAADGGFTVTARLPLT